MCKRYKNGREKESSEIEREGEMSTVRQRERGGYRKREAERGYREGEISRDREKMGDEGRERVRERWRK